MPTGVFAVIHSRHAAQLAGQVCWRGAVQTQIDKDCKPEVQAFRDTEPVEISQQRRHVVELARPEDKTSSGVEHRLQSVEQRSW